MAVETKQISALPVQAAPVSYTISGDQRFVLVAVRATFDGTSAAGAFLPCVRILSPAGTIMAQSVGTAILAGAQGDATFAPFLRSASSTGSGSLEVTDGSTTINPTTVLEIGTGLILTNPSPADAKLVVNSSLNLIGVFGNASDGSQTLTQTSGAPSYATKSGSGATTLFKLNRDIYCTDFHLDDSNGAFLVSGNGFRIFCTGTLTVAPLCILHADGGDAAGVNAGAAGSTGGTLGRFIGGGSNGVTGAGTATQATALTGTTIVTTTPGTLSHGGAGGNVAGGGGTGGGVAGGNVQYTAAAGTPGNIVQAVFGAPLQQGSGTTTWAGGGGGTGGDSTATSTSGGGGAGGSILGIYARTLVNNGIIRARGGAGAAATGSGTGAGGGGGGGGGGLILVYYAVNSTRGTLSVAGGAGGAFQGAGNNGATGLAGLIWEFAL